MNLRSSMNISRLTASVSIELKLKLNEKSLFSDLVHLQLSLSSVPKTAAVFNVKFRVTSFRETRRVLVPSLFSFSNITFLSQLRNILFIALARIFARSLDIEKFSRLNEATEKIKTCKEIRWENRKSVTT